MAIALQLAPHMKGRLASQRLHPEPFRSAISPGWVPTEISSTQQSLCLVSFCLRASDRSNSFAADRQIERSLEPTVLSKITIIEKAIQLSFEEGQPSSSILSFEQGLSTQTTLNRHYNHMSINSLLMSLVEAL